MTLRSKAMVAALMAATAVSGLLARSGFNWDELEAIDRQWPQAAATSTGLRYVVVQEGHGEVPKPGDQVSVVYKGMFFNGEVFDQSLNPDKPFVFRLGRGQIITGWEEGIGMMRVGEKRILLVPYDLAYGSRGQPPRIPRRTSLVFEVEMLKVEPNPALASSK